MEVVKFIFVLCILLHFVTTLLADNARNISFEYLCDRRDVVHVSADGSKDSIHYIYSSNGLPSVLIARTGTKNAPKLDCKRFHNASSAAESGSVTFSHPPDALMVLVFTRLIEYIDKDNTANMTDYKQLNSTWSYDLSSAYWKDLTYDNDSRTISLTANNDSQTVLQFLANGSLSLQFHVFNDKGYGSELPHLGYNENITHVDVVLDHLKSRDTQSRFAVELVLVADKDLSGGMSLTKHDTLDDEHSPGSFHSVDWIIHDTNQSCGAFLSWKPTCYTTNERKVSYSKRINNYVLQPHHFAVDSVRSSGLAFAVFGSLSNWTHVQAINVSFGGAKDKLYFNTTQYTVWTFSIGLGAPITDSFSLLLILLVAVGLGIPFLLIVVGGLYVTFRRLCDRHRGYTELMSSYAEIN